MAIAAADPAPAEVITWARGSATLPAAQTPEHAGPAGGIDTDKASLIDLAAQTGQKTVAVWHVARAG